jgi:hypothetical protein
MSTMNDLHDNAASRRRISAALSHRQPDRVPVDFGATNCSGIHVSRVAALRDYYGLEKRPVRVSEPGQMLGLIEGDLIAAMGIDTVGVFPRTTRFGFAKDKWKIWRLNGLEVLVPEGFTVITAENGDTLIYPQSDLSAPPSSRMPAGGFFFDNIIRQDAIDEEKLNSEDNLEEFGAIGQQDIDWFDRETARAAAKGLSVVASFGGTAFGDIANVPGPGLRHPKGIRDTTEWYVSTTSRRDYIHKIFDEQSRIALENLERIHAVVGDRVQAIFLCGTDFGTQTSAFCSVKTFEDFYFPYYKRVCDWIHAHTSWIVLKHSCGAVSKFLPSFIEAGIDILNPMQCSAAGMVPAELKANFGDRVVFWGGGVDTQHVLPFGTPAEVREQVLRRCEVFAPDGGFVFNTIHNIQAQTPVENIVAMIDAVREFNGS